MKHCIHCGKEIPEGAMFCPYCSAKQDDTNNTNNTNTTNNLNQNIPPRSNNMNSHSNNNNNGGGTPYSILHNFSSNLTQGDTKSRIASIELCIKILIAIGAAIIIIGIIIVFELSDIDGSVGEHNYDNDQNNSYVIHNNQHHKLPQIDINSNQDSSK